MLSEKNNKLVFDKYKYTVKKITMAIIRLSMEQESDKILHSSIYNDFVASSVNDFSSKFISEVKKDLPIEDFVEKTKNIYREKLMKFGIEADFIPDDVLVSYCCRETVKLMYYTDQKSE